MDNSSNASDTYCITSHGSTNSFNNIMVVLYSFVIITSVLGNILVGVIVERNKSMHTFTNYLICNCALADIIKMVPAILDVIEILPSNAWRVPLPLCTFWYACVILSLGVTNISLAITSVERYCAVFSPFKKKFTKNMLYVIIPITWLIGLAFASPANLVVTKIYVDFKGPVYLKLWSIDYNQLDSHRIYTPILFVFLYLVPLTIMAVTCTLIGRRLISVGKPQNSIVQISFRNRSDSKEDIYELSTQLTKEMGNIAHAKKRASRAKGFHKDHIIKMLMSILIFSGLSWFPVFCVQLLLTFRRHTMCVVLVPRWVMILVFFFPYVDSVIKPIIYIGYSRSYRRGLSGLSQRSRNNFDSIPTRPLRLDDGRYSNEKLSKFSL